MPRRITAKLYTDANVYVCDLQYETCNYDRRLNDTGSGSLTIPDGATGSGSYAYGMYVRFFVDGVADFTMLIEEINRVVLGEIPSDVGSVLQGREWVAEWSDTVVYPPMGVGSLPSADTVYFNYAHPSLDRSSWTVPVQQRTVFEGDYLSSPGVVFYSGPIDPFRKEPGGWTDIYSWWLWGEAVTGTPQSNPAGINYFINTFTAPVAAPATFLVTADNVADWWIDGVYQIRTDDFRTTYSIGTYLSAGTHRIVCRAENKTAPAGAYNPGSIAVVGYQQINSRFLTNDNIILRSSSVAAHGSYTASGATFEGWKCLKYPTTEPGFTAGKVVQVLLSTAQAQGALTGWSLSFSATNDTAGGAWPVLNEVEARVGDDLLTVLKSMADKGYIDFAADRSSRVLHAWIGGDRGNFNNSPATRPTYSYGTGNTLRVEVQGRR